MIFLIFTFFLSTAQPQFNTFIRKIIVRNPGGTTTIISETITQLIAQRQPSMPITPKSENQPQKIQVMGTSEGMSDSSI